MLGIVLGFLYPDNDENERYVLLQRRMLSKIFFSSA